MLTTRMEKFHKIIMQPAKSAKQIHVLAHSGQVTQIFKSTIVDNFALQNVLVQLNFSSILVF